MELFALKGLLIHSDEEIHVYDMGTHLMEVDNRTIFNYIRPCFDGKITEVENAHGALLPFLNAFMKRKYPFKKHPLFNELLLYLRDDFALFGSGPTSEMALIDLWKNASFTVRNATVKDGHPENHHQKREDWYKSVNKHPELKEAYQYLITPKLLELVHPLAYEILSYLIMRDNITDKYERYEFHHLKKYMLFYNTFDTIREKFPEPSEMEIIEALNFLLSHYCLILYDKKPTEEVPKSIYDLIWYTVGIDGSFSYYLTDEDLERLTRRKND